MERSAGTHQDDASRDQRHSDAHKRFTLRRPRLQPFVLAAVTGSFCGLQLAAAPPTCAQGACAQPRVRWRSELSLPWQRALLAACDELAAAQGLDRDVEVRATQHGRAIQLEVSAGDGRIATRRVDNADELLMTMQALVLLPPAERASASAARSQEPARVDVPSVPALAQPDDPQPAMPRASSGALRQTLQAEISAALMGRLAFRPDYASPALWLSVGLHLHRYTFGIDVRWNPFQTLISRPHPVGLEIESLGAGLFVVHRVIDADWTGLDLGLHVFLSADTRALEENEAATESTQMDGRLGVLARWGIGTPTARWMILLDAELSPARLSAYSDFPTFSVGLGAGGVWEVK